jgi:hypothetical protein
MDGLFPDDSAAATAGQGQDGALPPILGGDVGAEGEDLDLGMSGDAASAPPPQDFLAPPPLEGQGDTQADLGVSDDAASTPPANIEDFLAPPADLQGGGGSDDDDSDSMKIPGGDAELEDTEDEEEYESLDASQNTGGDDEDNNQNPGDSQNVDQEAETESEEGG